jgi:hypothetical protein
MSDGFKCGAMSIGALRIRPDGFNSLDQSTKSVGCTSEPIEAVDGP